MDSDGEYQFFVGGGDGFRMHVHGWLIIDEWRDQAAIMRDDRAKGQFTLTK